MYLNEHQLRARLSGISHATVHRWIKAGLLPAPMKLGPRKVGWRIADIEKWEAERKVSPAYKEAQ